MTNHTLKQCQGMHCRCMNLKGSCRNYHYADCESYSNNHTPDGTPVGGNVETPTGVLHTQKGRCCEKCFAQTHKTGESIDITACIDPYCSCHTTQTKETESVDANTKQSDEIDEVGVMNIRHRVLHELDPDFTDYAPDQGMPPTVWHLNDAQIDYIIKSTIDTLRSQEAKRVEEAVKKVDKCIGVIKASAYDAPRTQIEIHHIEKHLQALTEKKDNG